MCSPFQRLIRRFDRLNRVAERGSVSGPDRGPTLSALGTTRATTLLFLCVAGARGQLVTLDPMVVSTDRAPIAASQVANSVDIFTADDLKDSPELTADETLRSVPSFSLFRRNDSLTANPTSQGVSLRGLGPSGASRSLVLLDGLPLNDPFGGWITWSELPRDGLDRVEIIPGGGASAWGDDTLGGVIQLFTAPPAAGGSLSAWIGDFSTRGAEVRESVPLAGGFLELSGQDFATDGTLLIAPAERGPIDIPAASQHHWASGKLTEPVGSDLTVTLSGRVFNEYRNNGTPYEYNTTRTQEAALQIESHAKGMFNWSASAFAQDENFTSTYSSVNATRTAETPASIQFDVPASAFGAEWNGTWTEASGARTTAGVDEHAVRGETREDFQYTAGAYTRQRYAGGEQSFDGLFALREQPLGDQFHLSIGARLDRWDQWDGHRLETQLGSGAILRDDQDPQRAGYNFSPSLGLVWQAVPDLRIRASGQQAFRAPTLNELYRPYRQGTNDIEANPALVNETDLSGELGADYHHGIFSGSVAAFIDELHHAVANVTLTQGPSTTAVFGTLTAGTTGLQRLNLDRTQVEGVETSARLEFSSALQAEAAAIFNDARVESAVVAPQLVGKQLAEVPKIGASLSATWRPIARLRLTPRVRYIGRQFDDDLNQLPLASAVVTDIGARYQVSVHLELFLDVQNLTDETVETSHSSTGVFGQDTPRLAFGGLRFGW